MLRAMGTLGVWMRAMICNTNQVSCAWDVAMSGLTHLRDDFQPCVNRHH